MSYGVQPTGFVRKTLNDVLLEIEQANIATLGPAIIQTTQSPLGQINGVMAEAIAIMWEALEDTYQSYDPAQAEGIRLEMLGRIRLLQRGGDETDADFRQAIMNVGRARVDLQDLARAIAGISGVTYRQIFINDGDAADANGIPGHSVAVAVTGGSNDEIATTIRDYVVPGIGTYGNTQVDTTIEGYCRTVFIVRPIEKPVTLAITVRTRPDTNGCPPPPPSAIEASLYSVLVGDRQLVNGEDVTLYAIRSRIESTYPNVEVVSVTGAFSPALPGALPLSVSFFEKAVFTLAGIDVAIVP